MMESKVVVPWRGGLHLRAATKLVKVACGFRANLSLECGGKKADLGSILSIITLCATMGTTIDLRATGEDEQAAVAAVEQVFSSDDVDQSPKTTLT